MGKKNKKKSRDFERPLACVPLDKAWTRADATVKGKQFAVGSLHPYYCCYPGGRLDACVTAVLYRAKSVQCDAETLLCPFPVAAMANRDQQRTFGSRRTEGKSRQR